MHSSSLGDRRLNVSQHNLELYNPPSPDQFYSKRRRYIIHHNLELYKPPSPDQPYSNAIIQPVPSDKYLPSPMSGHKTTARACAMFSPPRTYRASKIARNALKRPPHLPECAAGFHHVPRRRATIGVVAPRLSEVMLLTLILFEPPSHFREILIGVRVNLSTKRDCRSERVAFGVLHLPQQPTPSNIDHCKLSSCMGYCRYLPNHIGKYIVRVWYDSTGQWLV